MPDKESSYSRKQKAMIWLAVFGPRSLYRLALGLRLDPSHAESLRQDLLQVEKQADVFRKRVKGHGPGKDLWQLTPKGLYKAMTLPAYVKWPSLAESYPFSDPFENMVMEEVAARNVVSRLEELPDKAFQAVKKGDARVWPQPIWAAPSARLLLLQNPAK